MGSGASSSSGGGRSGNYLAMFSKDSAISNALGSSWTEEERLENEKAIKLYERLVALFQSYYFSGVKVRQGRKGLDPQAPLWIEPCPEFYNPELSEAIASSPTSPSLNQETSPNKRTSVDREIQVILKNTNITNADQLYNAEREKYLKAIPTGILLKCDGNVKVLFTLTGTEYEFQSSDVDKYLSITQGLHRPPPAAAPPLAKVLPVNYLFPAVTITNDQIRNSKTRSILLSWSNRLPFPLGLVHQIEVQYSAANANHAVVTKFQKIRDELYENSDNFSPDSVAAAQIHDIISESAISTCKADFQQSDTGEEKSSATNANENNGGSYSNNSASLWKPWLALTSKSMEYPDFGSFIADSAAPGGIYSYRIRYRCASDWSPFSSRSLPVAAPPALPDPPSAVKASFTTAVAALISWTPPASSNGCKIKEYVLYCRLVDSGPSKEASGLVDDDVVTASSSLYTASFQEVYRGSDLKFLVTGLTPQSPYGFTVTAVTFAGESKLSEPLHVLTSPLVAFRHLRALLKGSKRAKAKDTENSILDIINGTDVNSNNEGKQVLGVEFSDNIHLAKEQFEFSMSCRLAWRVFYDSASGTPFYFNIITSVRTREMPAALLESSPAAQSTIADNRNYNNNNNRNNRNNRNNDDNNVSSSAIASELESDFGLQFRRKRFQLYSKLRSHLQVLQKSTNRTHKFNLDKSPSKGKKAGSSASSAALSSSPLARIQAAATGADTESLFSEPPRGLAYDEDVFDTDDGTNGEGNGNKPYDAHDDSDINRSRDGVLIVNVHRETLLFDAYSLFMRFSWSDMTRKLKFVFVGESGVDSGGLGREAFLLISRQIIQYAGKLYKSWLTSVESSSIPDHTSARGRNPNKLSDSSDIFKGDVGAYFISSDYSGPGPNASASSSSANTKAQSQSGANDQIISPNSVIDQDENQLSSASIKALDGMNVTKASFMFFIGVFMGKALLDGQIIDLRWNQILYQHIISGLSSNTIISKVDNGSYKVFDVNWPIGRSDLDLLLSSLNALDPQLASSMTWMMNNDIKDAIDESFTVLVNSEPIDLCPCGSQVAVTNANKLHYIRLICTWKTQYCLQESLQALLEGFHGLVPLDLIASEDISASDMRLILSGKTSIDVHEVRAYCIYQATLSMALDLAKKAEVPFNEEHFIPRWFFKILEEAHPELQKALIKFVTGTACVPNDGYDPPFCITYGGSTMDDDSLPRAHTCFHQIVLPHYTSFEKMRERIVFAVENTSGFELM